MFERGAYLEEESRKEGKRANYQKARIANKEKGIGYFTTSWPSPSGSIPGKNGKERFSVKSENQAFLT
jgi:hypothetical protein